LAVVPNQLMAVIVNVHHCTSLEAYSGCGQTFFSNSEDYPSDINGIYLELEVSVDKLVIIVVPRRK
jgi:hypothetical protein